MKVLQLFSFLLLLFICFSCQKEAMNKQRIVQHCTGSYLKVGATQYLICNKSLVDDYEDCTPVIASFEQTSWEDCTETWAACYMEMLPHEGMVYLNAIRRK